MGGDEPIESLEQLINTSKPIKLILLYDKNKFNRLAYLVVKKGKLFEIAHATKPSRCASC